MQKHYFASANTGIGFVNKFNNILASDRQGFMYIIKGGPGTGKNTILKKIAKVFESYSDDVEYFHCSTDANSLDGVKCNKSNIAVIDGTSPHATDCILANVKDKIINVGDFISDDILKFSDILENENQLKKQSYTLAYGYLKSIYQLDVIKTELESNITDKNASAVAYNIFNNLDKQNIILGNKRELFISAFNNFKEVNFITDNSYTNIISLNENKSSGTRILEIVNSLLSNKCIQFTTFLDLINPNKIMAIEIPSINTLICLDNKISSSCFALDPPKDNNKQELSTLNNIISTIQNQAYTNFDKAKSHHMNLEKYYVKAMDFNAVTTLTEKLIAEIKTTLTT